MKRGVKMKYFLCYDNCEKDFLEITKDQERLLWWLFDNGYLDKSCTDIIKINDECKKV